MPTELLEKVAVTLRRELPDLRAVYLFGSRARGTANPQSDYDLAVLPASPLDPVRLWEVQGKLAELVRAEVDLIDLLAASTVMRVEVLRSAELLLDTDSTARALFEATALSAFARLNEERRRILEDVRARGTVYG